MIQGLWHKYTSPTTKYEKGQISNAKQAEAASNVGKLEVSVQSGARISGYLSPAK